MLVIPCGVLWDICGALEVFVSGGKEAYFLPIFLDFAYVQTLSCKWGLVGFEAMCQWNHNSF